MSYRHVRTSLAVLLTLALGTSCQDNTGPQFVDALSVSPSTVGLEVGGTASLEVLPLGPRGEEYPDRAARVEWTVLDDDVATVSPSDDGRVVVTAEGAGSTVVRARLGRGTTDVPVQVLALVPDRVVIEPSPVQLPPGGSTRIQARLYRNDVELPPGDYDFSWASFDTSVLLVVGERDQARLIARNAGRTSVRVTVAGRVAVAPVTVEQ